MHICEKCYNKPGSESAKATGCNCPTLDNGHGHVHPNHAVMRGDCPMHGLPADKKGEKRGE